MNRPPQVAANANVSEHRKPHIPKDEVRTHQMGVEKWIGSIGEQEQNPAKAAIYAMYTANAATEDEVLVNRWTETLNILLTFAGLQSALVTAFIIALDPNLRPDSKDTTVEVLLQILHRMDNSTVLPAAVVGPWVPPTSAVQTSAWWYSSLACSLLSAFGALLSKQWVLHYRSQLPWVMTAEGKAELREARYQGMRTWHFLGVIESLPILLQLSLLFFGIGITKYLHPISPVLFYLSISAMVLGAFFYAFTLICGMFFPSCPFKSPVTTLICRTGYKGLLFLALMGLGLLEGGSVICRFFSSRNRINNMGRAFTEVWKEYSTLHLSYWYEKSHGEAVGVGENSTGAGGVLCWWLYQDDKKAKDNSRLNPDEAINTIVSFPPHTILRHFQTTDVFESWCRRVILDFIPPPGDTTAGVTKVTPQGTLREIEVLSHFMYHSSAVTRIVMSSVNFDNCGRFCKALRTAYSDPNAATPLRLPVTKMRWTTVAVYLQAQLDEWCTPRVVTDDAQHRDLVVQELPDLLDKSQLVKHLPDLANVVSLAAIAYLYKDKPDIYDKEQLVSSTPVEQLIFSLDRVSHYDPTTLTISLEEQRLLPRLVRASRLAIERAVDTSGLSILSDCGLWKNGKLGDVILRLFDLGTALLEGGGGSRRGTAVRHGGDSAEDPGGALVFEVFAFVKLIFDYISSSPGKALDGLTPLCSAPGLKSLLDVYASIPAPLASNLTTLQALDYILELFYSRSTPSLPHSPHRPPCSSSLSQSDIISPLLQKNILRQLIQIVSALQSPTLENDATSSRHKPTQVAEVLSSPKVDHETASLQRGALLLVIVRGRQLFFPPSITCHSQNEDLGKMLDELAKEIPVPGTFQSSSSGAEIVFREFKQWDELLLGLRDLQLGLRRQETLYVPPVPIGERYQSAEDSPNIQA